jgi:hypothetical protein
VCCSCCCRSWDVLGSCCNHDEPASQIPDHVFPYRHDMSPDAGVFPGGASNHDVNWRARWEDRGPMGLA